MPITLQNPKYKAELRSFWKSLEIAEKRFELVPSWAGQVEDLSVEEIKKLSLKEKKKRYAQKIRELEAREFIDSYAGADPIGQYI